MCHIVPLLLHWGYQIFRIWTGSGELLTNMLRQFLISDVRLSAFCFPWTLELASSRLSMPIPKSVLNLGHCVLWWWQLSKVFWCRECRGSVFPFYPFIFCRFWQVWNPTPSAHVQVNASHFRPGMLQNWRQAGQLLQKNTYKMFFANCSVNMFA